MSEGTEKKHILVIEDDDGIREMLQMILEHASYQVTSAANGKEALEILSKDFRPGLILLDLMMPVMNGWQFLEMIKQKEGLSLVPVLIISADPTKTITTNAVGFLEKPLNLDVLLDQVKRHYKEAA